MKKILIFFIALFSAFISNATNYYVSNAGNDALAGTSEGTAWRTLAKVKTSFALFNPGDSIKLKRGDFFNETLTLGKGGNSLNPIVICAYGTGNKPVITGYKTLTGFSSYSGNIYKVYFPEGTAKLMNVSFDGKMTHMGRYPNPDGDTLRYEAFTSNTNIVDNNLPLIAQSGTWIGAELAIRKYQWVWDRAKITAQSGGNFTYGFTGLSINPGTQSLYRPSGAGYGYFFQNALRTLDQNGEWYHNPINDTFYIYSNTNINTRTVLASILDTGINVNNKNYITIDSVEVNGFNISGIFTSGSTGLSIKNSTVKNTGAIGIHTYNSSVINIDNNFIDSSLATGIQVASGSLSDVTIKNNFVNNSFVFHGMGDYNNDPYCMRGISAYVNTNLTVKFNKVYNSGYSGVTFNGSNVYIDSNDIRYATKLMGDNGPIYTFTGPLQNSNGTFNYGAASPVYTNRHIRGNKVVGSTGNKYATRVGDQDVWGNGIYLDGKTINVNVEGNFIDSCTRGAITTNNSVGVTIRGNTIVSRNFGIRLNTYRWGMFNNVSIKKNIFIIPDSTSYVLTFATDSIKNGSIANQLRATLSSDSNYIYSLNSNPYSFEGAGSNVLADHSIDAWRLFVQHDLKSVVIRNYPGYKINSLVGANKITNPFFNGSITGFTIFSGSQTWDNTNQIINGTLKVTVAGTTARSYGSPMSSIGNTAISDYIVRFKTKGIGYNGTVFTTFRRNTSPYPDITDRVKGSFGQNIKDHEVLLTASSISSARVSFYLDATSGVTYMDNVEVYQADVTKHNLSDSIIIVSNEAATKKAVVLNNKYVDAYGTEYQTEDSVGAYNSRIYFYKSAADVVNNVPPTVDAGANQTIKLPVNSVSLSGTANDSDGSISTARWFRVSGPANVVFSNINNLNTNATFTLVGTYVLSLTVKDNDNDSTTDVLTIIVEAQNILPIANAGIDKEIQLPVNSTVLNGSATDEDGTISTYLWTRISGPNTPTLSGSSSPDLTIGASGTTMIVGTYVYRLTVTDNDGGTDTDDVTIIVKPVNVIPTAQAGSNVTITLPINQVLLNGGGIDVDGTISKFKWANLSGGSLVIVNSDSASTMVTNLTEGTYTLTLIVTDNQDAESIADSITITVNPQVTPPANNPPVVNMNGNSVSIRLPLDSVYLNTTVTDSDGTIVSYLWSKVSGPSGAITIVNPTSEDTRIRGLKSGIYVFSLRVRDNLGAITTNYKIIYVYRSRSTTYFKSIYKFENN